MDDNNKENYKSSVKTLSIVSWVAFGLAVLTLFLVAIALLLALIPELNRGATGPRGNKGDKGDKGNQGIPGPIRAYQYSSVVDFNYDAITNDTYTFVPGQIVNIQGTNVNGDALNIRLPNGVTPIVTSGGTTINTNIPTLGDTITIFNNSTSMSPLLLKVNGVTLVPPSSAGSNTDIGELEPNESISLTLTNPQGPPGSPTVLTTS